MRTKLTFLLSLCCALAFAQPTYNSGQFAAVGDLFYITSANNLLLDYETTGTNYNWNFSALEGTSQSQLQFITPTSTGFLWPFLFSLNNTNMAGTNNESETLNNPGQVIQITNSYAYFKKSTTDFQQTGSAYKVNFNGTNLPVTNQYTNPDIMYRFPMQYGNTDSDNSAYTINIPTLIYQENALERTNEVDGWGSVSTPYGNYSNVLRMKTTLVSNDSIALFGVGTPRTTTTTRELKWFDTTQKLPVLRVIQRNQTGIWVTTSVEYLDAQRDFQTTAFCTYQPQNPVPGDTVYFQNLSSNATTFSWDFGDPGSGTDNTSTDEFPTHTYAAEGVYTVQLTASNATFSDTYTFIIVIGSLSSAAFDASADAAVFPNPFTNKIHLTKQWEDANFDLTSMTGQSVYSGKDIESADFSSLSPGMYILTITANGEVKRSKILKQ